jgi:hypothetical protein
MKIRIKFNIYLRKYLYLKVKLKDKFVEFLVYRFYYLNDIRENGTLDILDSIELIIEFILFFIEGKMFILVIISVDINRRCDSVFLSHFEVLSEVLISAPVCCCQAVLVRILEDRVEV